MEQQHKAGDTYAPNSGPLPVGTKMIAVDVVGISSLTEGNVYESLGGPVGQEAEFVRVIGDRGTPISRYVHRFAPAIPKTFEERGDYLELREGDRVTCVDSRGTNRLHTGETYTVNFIEGPYIHLVDVAPGGYYPTRFVLAEPEIISADEQPDEPTSPLDLDAAIGTVESEVAAAQKRADDAEAMLEKVRVRMVAEAERRGWCDDFNRIADEIGFNLKGPKKMFYVSFQQVEVEAEDEAEARRLVHARGDRPLIADVAARQTIFDDAPF